MTNAREMSNKIAEFKKLMTEKAKSQVPIQTEWVTVKSVNWDDKTMVGTGELNELDYEDVLLGLGAVYKKPKVGSLALVGKINNSAGCFLIDCEAYDQIEVNSKLTNLQVKEKGVRIVKGTEDLRKILEDFMCEKNKMNLEVQKIATKAGAVDSIPILAEILIQTELIIQRLNTVLTSE